MKTNPKNNSNPLPLIALNNTSTAQKKRTVNEIREWFRDYARCMAYEAAYYDGTQDPLQVVADLAETMEENMTVDWRPTGKPSKSTIAKDRPMGPAIKLFIEHEQRVRNMRPA